MRIDLAHLGQRSVPKQTQLNRQKNLGANSGLALDETVERGIDRTLLGIFDRHHAIVGPSAFHRFENLPDSALGAKFDRTTEMAGRRLVAERRPRAEISHLDCLLKRAHRRKDFAVNGAHARFRQSARVGCDQTAQQVLLALRSIVGVAALVLDPADFLDQAGPFTQQLKDPVVDPVDGGS